MKATF